MITQFGLSWYFDAFERGGGVDTLHNADVYDKEKELRKNDPNYESPVSVNLQNVMKNREAYDGKNIIMAVLITIRKEVSLKKVKKKEN